MVEVEDEDEQRTKATRLFASTDALTIFVIFRWAFLLAVLFIAAEIWRIHSFQIDFLLSAESWPSTNLAGLYMFQRFYV